MKTSAIAIVAVLGCVSSAVVGAQQLNTPATQASRPLGQTSAGNTLKPPVPVQNASVSGDPAQRQTAPVIKPKGPAVDAARPQQSSSVQPKPLNGPVRVTDMQGRIVGGAVQVGPNRVMDPRTGHYYNTMPDGDGQRIVEPTKP